MLFNALDFFIILTTTAIFTLASPIQLDSTSHLEIRAGPSGSLNYPYGGETFDNTNGLGKLPVSYNQVHQNNAQTISIDLSIGVSGTPPTPGDPITVVGLTSPDDHTPIKATFSLAGYCGNLALFVHETQLYNGKIIKFQSAAPSFVVNC